MKKESQQDINKFLQYLDNFREIFSKTQYIPPVKLQTVNRKDIDYRICFLKDVNETKIEPKKTLFYHFISDKNRGISRPSEESVQNFIALFDDIKLNRIKKSIIVGRYNQEVLDTRYFMADKIYETRYKNSTGLQLIDGAHRLAISLYLNLKEIPVKIYSPLSFKIPDYATYLRLNEKHYLSKIKEIK